MLDLVFMTDWSSSLNHWGNKNSEKIMNVLELVMSAFTRIHSRTAVVLYAGKSKLQVAFNATEMQRRHIRSNVSYPSGERMTGKALNFTREKLFTDRRINAHGVLVVISTGTSNDAVSVASKQLRDMNVTILVVVLGDWYDKKQVYAIASSPHSRTILRTTFSELQRFSWRVHEMICEGTSSSYLFY